MPSESEILLYFKECIDDFGEYHSNFGYNFVYLAAKDTGLGGGVEDIVFFLYRVCHIEGSVL